MNFIFLPKSVIELLEHHNIQLNTLTVEELMKMLSEADSYIVSDASCKIAPYVCKELPDAQLAPELCREIYSDRDPQSDSPTEASDLFQKVKTVGVCTTIDQLLILYEADREAGDLHKKVLLSLEHVMSVDSLLTSPLYQNYLAR